MHLHLATLHSSAFTHLKRDSLKQPARGKSQKKKRSMAPRVAVLLLLAVVCIGFAAAEIPVDCCLEVTDKHIPRSKVVGYIIQEAGQGCDISATVFITKAGRRLCAPQPSLSRWVRELINYLQKKGSSL